MTPGRRIEPAWFTTVDLMALVAGAALALSWFWGDWAINLPRNCHGPYSDWLDALGLVRLVLPYLSVAFIPVILARRATYGGLARPAEFALGCLGLPALLFTLVYRYFYRLLDRIARVFGAWLLAPQLRGFELCDAILLASGAASGSILWLGRRRLPGWGATICVFLAWQAVSGPLLGRWSDACRAFLGWIAPGCADRPSRLVILDVPLSLRYTLR